MMVYLTSRVDLADRRVEGMLQLCNFLLNVDNYNVILSLCKLRQSTIMLVQARNDVSTDRKIHKWVMQSPIGLKPNKVK